MLSLFETEEWTPEALRARDRLVDAIDKALLIDGRLVLAVLQDLAETYSLVAHRRQQHALGHAWQAIQLLTVMIWMGEKW